MEIIAYSNFAKKNNSTKQPTDGSTINVRLKESTSIIRPVFLLSGGISNYNYFKWGNRYYFVEDCVSVTNNLTEYHCVIDALASWKSEIGASSQYIVRSSKAFDTYLVDTLYPTKQKITVDDVYLSDLHSNFTGGSYVVGIINKTLSASGVVSYYAFSPSEFRNFISYLLADTSYMQIDPEEITENLQKALINPFQYVVSCNWFPFSIGGTGVSEIPVAYWSIPVGASVILDGSKNKVFSQSAQLPKHPKRVSRGLYLNGSPFTRYTLFCYNFGMIPINPMHFIDDSEIVVGIRADVFTGQGELYLADSDGVIFYKQAGNVGVPIQLAQVNNNPLGVAISTGATIGKMASGDVIGAVQGIVGAIENLMPQVQTTGMNGSTSSYVPVPKIVAEFIDVADDNNLHRGKPLCAERVVSSLGGYMVVSDAEIDLPCTQAEKDAIIQYMESGFFYE